jgi:hypothetical protein
MQDTGDGRLDGGLRRWDNPRGTAGAAAVMTPGMDLAPIPKTGATIDADSGKPLAAMVAAATDLPLTMLLGDPGTTGARAVAETLDEPTRLMAETRRELWTTVYKDICGYVIDQAVKAPRGPLTGTVRIDPYTGQQRIELAGGLDRTVSWTGRTWTRCRCRCWSRRSSPPTPPGSCRREVVCEMLLRALGVPDVDEVMASMRDEQGNFTPPAQVAQADRGAAGPERGPRLPGSGGLPVTDLRRRKGVLPSPAVDRALTHPRGCFSCTDAGHRQTIRLMRALVVDLAAVTDAHGCAS